MSGSVGAILWVFLVISALVVASEGLPPSEIRNINQRQSEPELSRIVSPGAPKQNINDSEKSPNNFNDLTSSLSAARALATYSPKATNGIHQSGLGRVGSGGGVALQRERYIHDWEVEDYVLLSTVDGSLYATDRKTGMKRWDISSNYPAVQITAYRANISHPVRDWIPDDNVVWIVEPVNGGQLYYYSPDSGLKKFGISVKGIVDNTPFSVEGSDKVYNGDKKTTTLSIDARAGKVQRVFSSNGPVNIMHNEKCKPKKGLEVEDLDDECESTEKIILIGRTEYTVTISNVNTGELLWTIRYTEWGPNNSDRDLAEQHHQPMDNRYIYSNYYGRIYGFEGDPTGVTSERRPRYQQDLMSPVTRIFDVVKSASSSSDAETSTFVVLPQPIVHAKDVPRDDKMTFVGLGKGGHFALSELSYPYVTHGADKAGCYSKGIDWPYLDHNERLKSIVGIHSAQFVYPDSHPHPASLPARSQDGDERPVQSSTSPPLPSSPSLGGSKLLGLAVSNPVDLSIVVLLFSLALYVLRGGSRKGKYKFTSEGREFQQSQSQQDAIKEIVIPGVGLEKPEEVVKPVPIVEVEQPKQPEPKEPNPTPPLVEETTIIAEARVPEDEPTIVADDAKSREVRFDPKPQEIKDEEETVAPAPPVTPKKKKAHRGQRGGARRRKGNSNSEKEEDRIDKIVNDAKKVEQEITLQPDMTDGSSMNEVETSKVVINGLEVYEDEILGRGSQGTTVCRGKFENRDVAVKRMLNDFVEIAEHEVKLLQASDDHPNVIRYHCKQKGGKFLYIALELCQASLNDFMLDPVRFQELSSALDATEVLHQIAAGVHHLHSLKIVHRDLKPQNILVSFPKAPRNGGRGAAKKPRLLISDFGLCKTLDDNQSSFKLTTHASPGTCGWRAPELLTMDDERRRPFSSPGNTESSGSASSETVIFEVNNTQRRATRAIDIFSMGCVFYFILTQGEHPFGDRWHRELNIISNKSDLSRLSILGGAGYEARDLISSMIDHNPKKRPDATKVMIHPFFWSAEKRLNFLLDVSDRFEVEKDKEKDPNYKSEWIPYIERSGNKVTGGDWLKRLDRGFLEELVVNKRRGYEGGKVLDLLRAIRNKKHHYQDMKPVAKASVGALPGQYLLYFTGRFPDLLLHAYHVIRETGFSEEPMFHSYFTTAVSTL
ncbi:hypothetical protein DFP73DRAFT_542098 [Morchella snyderi]|nr:hypothetical protein DFP73DRAFT_542098 [Morchella snyderi]